MVGRHQSDLTQNWFSRHLGELSWRKLSGLLQRHQPKLLVWPRPTLSIELIPIMVLVSVVMVDIVMMMVFIFEDHASCQQSHQDPQHQSEFNGLLSRVVHGSPYLLLLGEQSDECWLPAKTIAVYPSGKTWAPTREMQGPSPSSHRVRVSPTKEIKFSLQARGLTPEPCCP